MDRDAAFLLDTAMSSHYARNLPLTKESSRGECQLGPAAVRSSTIIRYVVPDRKALQARFRSWHVEALLNQAATLAEQCLAEAKEFCALDAAAEQFALQLKLDKDQKEAEASLRPDLEARQTTTAEKRNKYYTDALGDIENARMHAELGYSHGEQGGAGKHGPKAGQGSSEAREREMAFKMEKALAQLQVGWSEEDKRFQLKVKELREHNINRREELVSPGKAFAFEWQRDLVLQRLERSYADSYNRAFVAAEGLSTIYGRVAPHLPGTTSAGGSTVLDAVPAVQSISELANWVRAEIEWLTAYGQLDQSFTAVLSMRTILTDSGWERVKKAVEESRNDRLSLRFRAPASLFAAHENVRMRGVGACIVGKDAGRIPWVMVTRPPSKGVYVRNGLPQPVDQQALPKCTLGRVENRNSLRPMEVCGLISLMNASRN